jgi:uncharacterized OsmC-like protein
MTVHLRTLTRHGTSLGWSGGRSLTLQGAQQTGELRIGFDPEELLAFAVGASYIANLVQEASRQQVQVGNIAIDVSPDSAGDMSRSHGVVISVSLESDADDRVVMDLIEQADKATSVANLLRLGLPVRLTTAHVIRS